MGPPQGAAMRSVKSTSSSRVALFSILMLIGGGVIFSSIRTRIGQIGENGFAIPHHGPPCQFDETSCSPLKPTPQTDPLSASPFKLTHYLAANPANMVCSWAYQNAADRCTGRNLQLPSLPAVVPED